MDHITRRAAIKAAWLGIMPALVAGSNAGAVGNVQMSGSSWPSFSYDVKNSGHSQTRGPKRQLSEKWSFETGGTVRSSPVVADEMVYIGSDDGNVYALNGENGNTAWQFETDDSVSGSASVVDGTVYIGSTDETFYALNTVSGDKQWSFQANGRITAAPTVTNGTVYVGSDDDRLYALNANDGTEMWSVKMGSFVASTPAVADGTVYVGSADNGIYALDTISGDQRWTFKTENGVNSSPAVVDGTVYVTSSDGHIYAIDAATGDEQWTFPLNGLGGTSPAVANGSVYVSEGVSGKYIHTLDAETGERIRSGKIGDSVRASPAIADDVLYAASSDQFVYAIDVTDGSLLWGFETQGPVTSSPAVVGDTVYVGSHDNNIYALTGKTSMTPTTTATDSTTANGSNGENFPVVPALLGLVSLGGAGVWAYMRGPNRDDNQPSDGDSPATTVESDTSPSTANQNTPSQSLSDREPAESNRDNSDTSAAYDGKINPADTIFDGERQEPVSIPGAPDVAISLDEVTDETQLGQAGQSTVTRATIQTPTGEMPIAIQRPQLSGTVHSDTIEELLTAVETWDKLDSHDYIVDVIDYGSAPLPWIAMEYMNGGDLRGRREEMTPLQRLWTAISVTKGVYYAHRRGIAHLNLTPECIMFRSVEGVWDVPKVSDWWLKSTNSVEDTPDKRTLQYTAPEQLEEGQGHPDDITDVYRLGAVCYELFTGQPPFDGSPDQIRQALLEDDPMPPSEVADVPATLDEILLTALATNKSDRYDSLVYLRDAFKGLYTNE